MSSKSTVLANSFFYTFSALLVRAMGFLLLPIYTRFLTPEDYGITNLVNGFNQTAIFIISFSLYIAVVRFYTDYKDDREQIKRFYGTIIVFIFISSVIFVIIGILFRGTLIRHIIKGISFYPVGLMALLILIFLSLNTVHQSIMEGMQQGKKLTAINFIIFASQACLNMIFIGIYKLGATGILLATLITNLGYSLFMLFDLKRNNLITLCIDVRILIESLKYSIPIMPHNLSTHISNFVSRVLINNSSSLASVGLYSIASQFGSIIDTVQASVNQAFAPWFYDMMNSGNQEARKDIVNFSYSLILVYSLIYMGIGLFSQEAIIIMTNERYIMAWTAVPILVIAYSVKSIYYFYVNVLFFYKEASRRLFIATISGSFADIIIAFILVPKYGMYGAAFSFLAAKAIVVTIVIIISKRYDDIGFSVIEMLKIIVPSLLFMIAGLYFSYTKHMTVFSWTNLLYKLGVLSAYLIYIFITYKKNISIIINSEITKQIIRKLKSKNFRELSLK